MEPKKIYRSHKEAYFKLPKYCQDVIFANPDNIVNLSTTVDNKFHHIFLYYKVSQVFKACRPLFGVDRTHLKSKYQGILLYATSVNM